MSYTLWIYYNHDMFDPWYFETGDSNKECFQDVVRHWLLENKINVSYNNTRSYGCPFDMDLTFDHEIDAMAFKLRWI